MIYAHSQNIFLFHGKTGKPTGSVLQLEELLRPQFPAANFVRPRLLHGDAEISADESLEDLRQIDIPNGSAVIGISLGGLLAAKLQETDREDLHVVCISSPDWADGVRLTRRMANRLALYSSEDRIIDGRTSRWPQLAQAYDMPWLTHDTDLHKGPLSRMVGSFLEGRNVLAEIISVEGERRPKGTIA